jgi:ketosteroid isomerase-like protein
MLMTSRRWLALMSEDHTFIDANGNEVIGRETMKAGWRGYFEWFSNYEIEVSTTQARRRC